MSALVIFLGSFAAFALEPMVGRAVLPVFGGAPTVWVTCLAAFQLLMVAGYGYAGFAGGSGTRPARLRLHLGLLLLAAVSCAVVAFKKDAILASLSSATGIPALDVLLCALAVSALAFVLLSANATFVQSLSGGDYRLYAVSNLGSLLGLFCYPVLIEPFVALTVQWLLMAAAIAVYAALLFVLSVRGAKDGRREAEDAGDFAGDRAVEPSGGRAFLYFALPAVTAALLNATTAHLTLDIAPIPLLWAFLLGVFLLSYVIGFSGWSRPSPWAVPAAVAAGLSLAMYFLDEGNGFWGRLVCCSSALFLVSTFVHSWLFALRPPASGLSRFYLLSVVGGAAGGLLTSVAAPVAFDTVLEFPLALGASCAVLLVWAFRAARWAMRAAVALAFAGACAFQLSDAGFCRRAEAGGDETVLHRARGFFGTMSVIEDRCPNEDGTVSVTHGFSHGNTVHGIEFIGGGLERMPTAYYTPFGCGHAIIGHPAYGVPGYSARPEPRPMRVCLVGMGVGVSLVYARTNDFYRAYEISPEVAAIARDPRLFAFVGTCRSAPDIRVMDARKGLEAEDAAGEEPYDVLLVDAFSGDCIPYHLSTREAIELYLRRLKPDGILCVHFSNNYLDLRPYVKAIGRAFGLRSLVYRSANDVGRMGFAANVALFLREGASVAGLPVRSGMCAPLDLSGVRPLEPFPTDERGSFLPLLVRQYSKQGN